MAPQAKKNRVQCKNLVFYTTESLNEPFFAVQKRKNGAAGKKKNKVQPPGSSSRPFPRAKPYRILRFLVG